MSNVDEVRWRLLWERLRKVFRAAQGQHTQTLPDGILTDEKVETLLRLSGAVLALLEWHAMDAKGRCRVRGCARRRWVPWRKRRTCQMFVTVQFWVG
ncbi:MAG: hypothetical protein ACRDSP_21140 [Pseudonocardiaceae bacterium]